MKLSILSNDLLTKAAEIRGNAQFADAICAFARHYSDTFRSNALLSKIATEEARHLICGHMVALHYRRDIGNPESGITLSRLQDFSAKHGLASKNRVAALVYLLKHAGFLRPARSDATDKRLTILQPTELPRRALRKFVLPFLRALDTVNGDESLQARLERDELFQDAIVSCASDMYFDDCALLDAIPEMRLFSGRDAGYEILLRLWAMGDQRGRRAGEIISCPYGMIARGFGVSRAHVCRLMQSAAQQGYVILLAKGGQAVKIQPTLIELVELFVSLHLALYQCAINRVDQEGRHTAAGARGSPHAPSGGEASAIHTVAHTAPAVLSGLEIPNAMASKTRRFSLSVPFTGQDSFRHIIAGYQDAVERLGGSLTVVDANWDARKQVEQIASLVAARPDALFIVPTDPVAVSRSVCAAMEAGIPTFLCDSHVAGVAVTSTSLHDHFGMGAAAATYICKRLNGKGKIAIVTLPSNEAWDMRTHGMRFVLSRYPDIKVVTEWAYALTGSLTPRQAIEAILNTYPDIDAIWSAWDGAAIGAAQALRDAGRNDIFATGIDGGQEAFEYIKSGSAFCFTIAQSFYKEAYLNVYYAHQALAGCRVPRLVINPGYAVTIDKLPDTIPDTYDRPGVATKLGWQRVV